MGCVDTDGDVEESDEGEEDEVGRESDVGTKFVFEPVGHGEDGR